MGVFVCVGVFVWVCSFVWVVRLCGWGSAYAILNSRKAKMLLKCPYAFLRCTVVNNDSDCDY